MMRMGRDMKYTYHVKTLFTGSGFENYLNSEADNGYELQDWKTVVVDDVYGFTVVTRKLVPVNTEPLDNRDQEQVTWSVKREMPIEMWRE